VLLTGRIEVQLIRLWQLGVALQQPAGLHDKMKVPDQDRQAFSVQGART
jgi:hypothetical protein